MCVCVHVLTGNACSALLLVRPGDTELQQPNFCQAAGSGLISPNTMHTPSSFWKKKKSMMIKDTHYLFSLLGLLCVQTSLSWYDQSMLNSYLLTSLFYLHCSFQIKLPSILKKAQIVYSSWNLFCLLFICCKLTFTRTVNEEELVLFHWRLNQTLHWAVERKGCSSGGGIMRWRTWKTLRSYNDSLTVFLFPGLWPLVPTSWRGLFSLHWRNLSPQAHLKWSEMA